MCFNASATAPTSKVCPECGQKQDFKNKECTKCGYAFPEDFGVRKRTRECPECGLEQPFTNRVCSQCGFRFPKAKGVVGAKAKKGPAGPSN